MISQVLIFGKFTEANEPCVGAVSLWLPTTITDGSVITPQQFAQADLDTAGTVAIAWMAQDDSTTLPVGVETTIGESISGSVSAYPVVVSHLGLGTLITGSGGPSSGTGTNGQWYLDTVGAVLYQPKTAGAWPTPGTAVTNYNGQSFAGVLNLASVAP